MRAGRKGEDGARNRKFRTATGDGNVRGITSSSFARFTA